MAYFSYQNKKIYYKISGQGKPLLLIHGNSVSSKIFRFIEKQYRKTFQVIQFDFPGHGKSDRLQKFETDFWYYNSKVAYALIDYLKLEQVSVIGTSGGALVAINLGLEHPNKVNCIIADSFEGEYPLESYIKGIEAERQKDKKKLLAKLFWLYNHGLDWKKIVDMDTAVNIEFAQTAQSFFHQSISELKVPTLLTGSMEDEYCNHLDKTYDALKAKNQELEIHLFEKGKHPAMLSNKEAFFERVKAKINELNKKADSH